MALQQNRETLGDDGSVRKAHYGAGKQPWDTAKEMGLAAAFAAVSILKYLRRDKDPVHSQESARWYYARLCELAVADDWRDARVALVLLLDELTPEEKARLQ